MLSFATEFPVGHENSTQEFLSAVRVWILGSPHTRLNEDDLAELAGNLGTPIVKNDERVEALILKSDAEEAAGVMYRKQEENLEWATAIVFNKNASDAWVGIQVSRESERPAADLPPAKKPVVVKTLLDKLGGSSDGILRVGPGPHELRDVDVEIATSLISGKANCHLPVVYVSAGFHGGHGVDFGRLARDLSGMAHVVVEPNRSFSLRLQIDVDSENVYGGTVGVYWPDAAGRHSFPVGQSLESSQAIHRTVFEEIRNALTNRRALGRCTWSYIQEATSRQALAKLRASKSRDVDKYVETFDVEIAAKDQRLEEADKEIKRLQGVLRSREGLNVNNSGGFIQRGSEQNLYPNEIYGIVRTAIEDAKERARSDSRRKHVLSAILVANPLGDDGASLRRENLKKILKGWKKMDHQSKRSLEEMGFAITEDGKHYKLVFQGDDRYTFSLPKTSSDHRSGKNAAANIGNLLF